MATSATVAILIPKNLSQAEAQLGLIAHSTSSRFKLEGEMTKELDAVRARYQKRLDDLAKIIVDNTAAVEKFAAANPEVFPEGKKSLELLHGTIGFRTSPPQLKCLARATWEKVLAHCQEKGWSEFIRVKKEIDKAAVLKDAASETPALSAEDLRSAGLRIVQEESFYLDLKN